MALLLVLLAFTAAAQTPISRALTYLGVEAPKWRKENGCFSCHNNGDGVRALYAAGVMAPAQSTTSWLNDPSQWDRGKGSPAYSDKTLALYQFAAALTSAIESGASRDRQSLQEAARRLAAVQQRDGSWRVEDVGDAPGSPVTWGTTLATYFGLRTVRAAGRPLESIAKAEAWLRSAEPRYLIDEAAVLLAFPNDAAIRSRAIERFIGTQTSDGGWGPSLNAPAEVFDTAVVMLALKATGSTRMLSKGREFLLSTQQPPGGWPETTRPAGSQSYAQHISTTAWATLALLATEP